MINLRNKSKGIGIVFFMVFVAANTFCQNSQRGLDYYNSRILVGFGPSYIGYSAKVGVAVKDDILLLGHFDRQFNYGETYGFGLSGRKYYGTNKNRVFIQPGISYEIYKPLGPFGPRTDSNGMISFPETRNYKSPKISLVAGLNLPINKFLSTDIDFGYGYYTNLSMGRPIGRVSLNIMLGK